MCGIAELYNKDGRPVALGLLEAMTQALAHRGPDGEGYVLMAPGGREKAVPVIGRLSDSVGLRAAGVLGPFTAEDGLSQYCEGRHQLGSSVWRWVSLELWHQRFFP